MKYEGAALITPKYKQGSVFWYNQFQTHWNKDKLYYIKSHNGNGKATRRSLGLRPYIIISSDEFNELSSFVLAVPCTTSKAYVEEGDIYDNWQVQFEGWVRDSVSTIKSYEVSCVDKFCIGDITDTISDRLLNIVLENISCILYGAKNSNCKCTDWHVKKMEIDEPDIEETNVEIDEPILDEQENKLSNVEKFKEREEKYKQIQEQFNSQKNIKRMEELLSRASIKQWSREDLEFYIEIASTISAKEIASTFGLKVSKIYSIKQSVLNKLSKMISD